MRTDQVVRADCAAAIGAHWILVGLDRVRFGIRASHLAICFECSRHAHLRAERGTDELTDRECTLPQPGQYRL